MTFTTDAYLDYKDQIIQNAQDLLAIPSPSGYGKPVTDHLMAQLAELGIEAEKTLKGGVLAHVPGKNPGNGILLQAHVDTLGGMVHAIKETGGIQITPIGGLNPSNTETENVTILTRSGKTYEGTFQLENASVHVNKDIKNLGIQAGDYVFFEPRTRITKSGYIKSRFLDDKLSAAILLAYLKYLSDEKIQLSRDLYIHFTIYEEVGHGGSHPFPDGVTEVWSVDMGCVGEGLNCREKQVSIAAKDSGGPYNYELVSRLIELAEKYNIDAAVDIYPFYGSDVEATLAAGHDFRHALIGPGVYASHGYERSHIDGASNTFRLIQAYLED